MNKIFQKPWHSFRILPNVSMKHCSMNIEKTLLMYRACITKKSRETWQRLTDFWIKKNYIFRLFEKQMRSHCSIMHTLENTFRPMQMQRHSLFIRVNLTELRFWYLHSILFINATITDQSHGVYFFYNCHIYRDMQRCSRCSSWKMCTFIESFWLCSSSNYSYL